MGHGRGENLEVKIGGKKHDHDPPIILRRKTRAATKDMRAVSLHHHSTLSYKDGYGLPEAHVRRATELRMSALAMTEHGNVDSHVKLEIASKAAGIKPIYGVEFYTGPVGDDAKQIKYHLTVLAKDAEGYRNLMKLVSLSYDEGYYYEPTISLEMLKRYRKGLIVMSGCSGSLLFCSLVGGKDIQENEASYRRARTVARRFKAAFGENYFLEVQAFPELEKVCRANPMIARLGRDLGIRLVGTADVHYTHFEEAEVQMILHNLRGGGKKTIEEQAREWGYDVPLSPPLSDKSFYRRLRGTGLSHDEAVQGLVSTEEIAQECNVDLPKLPMTRFKVPNGMSTKDYWDEQLRAGWRYRGVHKMPASERRRYRAQLLKEKAIMEEKDFLDYMLIVQEGVVYIKDRDIPVGPGRGSAAASIVCWLLRITEINPMIFANLVFERFIDVSREDYPDIDLDFPSEARPMLRSYYTGRYGQGTVSNIGTMTVFKGKLAMDDVARVFKVPTFEVKKIKDFLIERSSGDLRASSTIEDTVEQFPQAAEVFSRYPELKKAELLEGNIKGFGVHAAGMVLSNHPIEDSGVCAIYRKEVPKGSGNIVDVVSLDKYDAERQGMVKIDFLGLSTMSMIWDALRELGMPINEMYRTDLTDPKVIEGFHNVDVVGVFQFVGQAARSVCGALKPDSFQEVCDVNALCRPGALHNGSASAYADIKHGRLQARMLHPAVDPILAPTKYQIVYQEQILRICREIGDFPWEKTAEIRKIIAKKHGNAAFNRRKQQFVDGALTVHERNPGMPKMDMATIESLWGDMITAGSYGFNAAHATAYGWLAWFTMWLKVYHPAVFYSSALKHLPEEMHRDLLRDARDHGIKIRVPEPAMSGASWQPIRRGGRQKIAPKVQRRDYRARQHRREMLAGFANLRGLKDKKAAAILEFRDEHGLSTWDDLINIHGIGVKTIEKIKEAVESDDPFGAFALDNSIRALREGIDSGEVEGLPRPTHTAAEIPMGGPRREVVWIGSIIKKNIRDIYEQNTARGGEGIDRSKIARPELNEYAMLICEDDTETTFVDVDRFSYAKMKHAIFSARPGVDLILVQGVSTGRSTKRAVKAKRIWVIDPTDEEQES